MDPIAWVVVRVWTAFCFAGLFIVVESWLNNAAQVPGEKNGFHPCSCKSTPKIVFRVVGH
jgi:hypothetical protein